MYMPAYANTVSSVTHEDITTECRRTNVSIYDFCYKNRNATGLIYENECTCI